MGRLLFLIFLVVPIIEIGIFIVIGQTIGLWLTLGGVVLTALLGSYIIRIQGVSLIREIQSLMGVGALPARQLVEGVMLAIAGALLLTPGYFTDFLGFCLLVPMVRDIIYNELKKRVSVRAGFGTINGGNDFYTGPDGDRPGRASDHSKRGDPDVIDLEDENWR